MRRLFLSLTVFMIAVSAFGQRAAVSVSDISGLPATCETGVLIVVKDGVDIEDCSTGSGSVIHACFCNAAGTGWEATAPTGRSCGHFLIGVTGDEIALTDEFTWRLPNFTGTLDRFECEAYTGTSFTVKLCDGEDRGDDTCTTDILSPATLVCGTSGASDTSLSATGFVAFDKVTLQITAISGTPTGEVWLWCDID